MHYTIQVHSCLVWLTRSTEGSGREPAFRGPREPNVGRPALSIGESGHLSKVV